MIQDARDDERGERDIGEHRKWYHCQAPVEVLAFKNSEE